MNRAYRSIWNEALGAWVAASELCSTQGKANKSSIPKVGRVSARIPLVFALGFVLGESAMANNLAVGDDAKNMIGYAVSRTKNGYETLAGGDDTNANTAVGTSATANGGRSTAIGDTATATGFHSVAIGADSKATGNGSVAVGNDSTDDAQSNVFSVGNRETNAELSTSHPAMCRRPVPTRSTAVSFIRCPRRPRLACRRLSVPLVRCRPRSRQASVRYPRA